MVGMSGVWDERKNVAYIFGGAWGPTWDMKLLDEILQFTPSTGEVKVLRTKLPTARIGTTAVWWKGGTCPNGCAYIIGGREKPLLSRDPYGLIDEVLKFDPTAGTVSVFSRLPTASENVAPASNNAGKVFLFGGDDNGTDDGYDNINNCTDCGPKSSQILVLDLATGAITSEGTMPVGDSLPPAYEVTEVGREMAMAVWDPTTNAQCPSGCAYVIGGNVPDHLYSWHGNRADDILRYSPASPAGSKVTRSFAKVPQGVFGGAAATDSSGIHIIAGCCNNQYPRNWIVHFDQTVPAAWEWWPGATWQPQTAIDNAWNFLPWSQSTGGSAMASALTGSAVYLFGGWANDWPYMSNRIMSYDLRKYDASRAQFYWAPWEDYKGVQHDGVYLDGVRILSRHLGETRPRAGPDSMHGPWGDGRRSNTRTLYVSDDGDATTTFDGYAYVLGGEDNQDRFAWIDRYHPGTGEVTRMASKLQDNKPYAGLASMGAVWNDRKKVAYIFGGFNASRELSDVILEYEPKNDRPLSESTPTGTAVTNLASKGAAFKLPSGRAAQSAVWDGRDTPDCPGGCAYIFGGADWTAAYAKQNQVLRFNPEKGITVMKATLGRIGKGSTAAVWDPVLGMAFIFGDEWNHEVLAYNPLIDVPASSPLPSAAMVNLSFNVLGQDTGVRLPPGSWSSTAVWDGIYAYILGSSSRSDGSVPDADDQWVRFDPRIALGCSQSPTALCGKLAFTLLDARLPPAKARIATSGFCRDGMVDLVGGHSNRNFWSFNEYNRDDIARYSLPLTALDDTINGIVGLLPTIQLLQQVRDTAPDIPDLRQVGLDLRLISCNNLFTKVNGILYRIYDLTEGQRRLVYETADATKTKVVDVACSASQDFELQAVERKADASEQVLSTHKVNVSALKLTATPGPTAGTIGLVWNAARCESLFATLGTVTFKIYEVSGGSKTLYASSAAGFGSASSVVAAELCKQHTFVVEAESASGEVVARSNLATAATMDVPRNVAAQSGPSIRVTWTPGANCEVPSAYQLYRAVGAGDLKYLAEVLGNALEYVDKNVIPLGNYSYQVRAVYNRGVSQSSASASAAATLI